MSAQAWMIVGILGFSLAGVMLLVAVLLFIRNKIPAVLGELSGRTEKKQIQKMRQAKAAAANKVHNLPQGYEREIMAANRQDTPQDPHVVEVTDVLGPEPSEQDMEEIGGATGMLIEEDANATTVLSNAPAAGQTFPAARPIDGVDFRIVKSVVVVHTVEFLE